MTDAAPTFAIVTGGGTAGHVNPALAIAGALEELGHARGSIHYVGSERGIERDLLPPTGYPTTLLPGRGIQRSFAPRAIAANVGAVIGLIGAGLRAVALVRRLRPRVVVAVGGYASLAVGLAAALWRVPLVVAEQNLVPGRANRLLARFAAASAVSFPGTPLPRAEALGNPIRAEITALDPDRDRAAARTAFGVPPERRLVLVAGGSLGALSLNRATLDALDAWRDRSDLAVHHVVGRRDWEQIHASSPVDLGRLWYRAVPYEEAMPVALAAADVAVSRSGSSACFELAAAALPSILVPSPYVTDDQQTGNARFLVDAGAAALVVDRELDGARLVAEVEAVLADDDRWSAMVAAAHRWAHPRAAADIAALVESHARG